MADSSKDIQLRELKDMINDLKKMIKTLQATVDAANKREEALTQERDNLKEEIDLLRKKLFGTSSEKRTLDIPGQLNFFNEAELEQDPEAAKAEDLETILPEKTAKKRKARATDAERFKGVPIEKKYPENVAMFWMQNYLIPKSLRLLSVERWSVLILKMPGFLL